MVACVGAARWAVALLVTAFLASACDGSQPRDSALEPSTPTPSPEPVEVPQERPRLLLVESTGPVRERLETAVRDLKQIGMWKQLTSHLYRVELDSRPGTSNVPDDGHLADAYYTGIVEGRGGGEVCDVMFFPTAVTADLARWRSYYGGGLIAEPPPSLRAFYGSLVAHELAHCRQGGWGEGGEDVARSWEKRALDALRAAGI